jgi:hypothetical protein
MLAHVQATGAEMVKLSGWFLYDTNTGTFGYLDLVGYSNVQFMKRPYGGLTAAIHKSTEEWNYGIREAEAFGYGFSLVWRNNPLLRYKEEQFQEDYDFVKSAMRQGFRFSMVNDEHRCALVVKHTSHLSGLAFQYVLPEHMLQTLFQASLVEWLSTLREAQRPRALHGAKVTATMEAENHFTDPILIFDGLQDTYYATLNAVQQNDELIIDFHATPLNVQTVHAQSGFKGDADTLIGPLGAEIALADESGVYRRVCVFKEGLCHWAGLEPHRGIVSVRLRVLHAADQLIINEITLT